MSRMSHVMANYQKQPASLLITPNKARFGQKSSPANIPQAQNHAEGITTLSSMTAAAPKPEDMTPNELIGTGLGLFLGSIILISSTIGAISAIGDHIKERFG